jgi:hypothetical protein
LVTEADTKMSGLKFGEVPTRDSTSRVTRLSGVENVPTVLMSQLVRFR